MKHIIIFTSLLFVFGCTDKPSKEMPNSWHGSMQGLAESLTEIMPNLITTSWIDEATQKKDLEKAIAHLAEYGETLNPKRMLIPSHDLSIGFLAQDFSADLQRVKTMAKTAPFEDIKPEIRKLARYCVACHTRTQSSSSLFTADSDRKMKGFNHFEQATYLTSMRQYEKAMVNYEEALSDKDWAQINPQKWNEGAMNLLAISIRVKKDANLTLELISQLFDTDSFPKDLYKAARVWQKDARQWNKEKPSKASLKQVKHMLDQANEREKKLEHSGLLLNVRASAALNEYLRAGSQLAYREQAFLYYSGVIAERLQKLNFSEFPASYFKACVSVNATNSLAKMCEKHLQPIK